MKYTNRSMIAKDMLNQKSQSRVILYKNLSLQNFQLNTPYKLGMQSGSLLQQ